MFTKISTVSTRAVRSSGVGRTAFSGSLPFKGSALAPVRFASSAMASDPFWQKINQWATVSKEEFMNYNWQIRNTVEGSHKLHEFLTGAMPEQFKLSSGKTVTRDEFQADVNSGIEKASMMIRIPPYVLSLIDWNNPVEDGYRRQFMPLGSEQVPDHPMLALDSLHEEQDSPVPGLVHRYEDKCLFLVVSHCPLYCTFCTRSYAVGGNTGLVQKHTQKPSMRRWLKAIEYIRNTPKIRDVVVSGGDTYSLDPRHVTQLGAMLLDVPNVQRIRFATKGLAINPTRILDPEDEWANAIIELSRRGREIGKAVVVHTHFNSPREGTWIAEKAAQRFFGEGVTVRNQSVLIKGLNDTVETMSELIRWLADNNIQPYYVYQHDMVKSVEHLRTPLSTILHLEKHIRGSIAGFATPNFIVDLPGGGGKRLAATFTSYENGRSTFEAPSVKGNTVSKKDRVYEYYDPEQ